MCGDQYPRLKVSVCTGKAAEGEPRGGGAEEVGPLLSVSDELEIGLALFWIKKPHDITLRPWLCVGSIVTLPTHDNLRLRVDIPGGRS